MVACGGKKGGGNTLPPEPPKPSHPELTLSVGSLTMKPEQTASVKILTGSGSYDMTVQGKEVISATLQRTEINIRALQPGEAGITVTDTQSRKTKSVSIKVEKPLKAFSTSKNRIIVGRQILPLYNREVIEKDTILITSGNGKYQIKVDKPGVISHEIENNEKIIVTAQATGTATMTIIDQESGQEIRTAIQVIPMVVVSSEGPFLKNGNLVFPCLFTAKKKDGIWICKSGSNPYKLRVFIPFIISDNPPAPNQEVGLKFLFGRHKDEALPPVFGVDNEKIDGDPDFFQSEKSYKAQVIRVVDIKEESPQEKKRVHLKISDELYVITQWRKPSKK